jgi:YfiH family protein
VTPEFIIPDWNVPARALVTTRALGDVKEAAARAMLRRHLPGEPCWLKQVHGIHVIDASRYSGPVEADAAFTRSRNVVCAVMAADCMPVLLADEKGEAVGAAHAGWRGLSAGVIEATVTAMNIPAPRVHAWLGPAIGPQAYEIGPEVHEAFLKKDPKAESAFTANRPGHWLLDLYAVARQRLGKLGVTRIGGGGFCTHSEAKFFSYRRDRTSGRMAAVIWLP